MNRRRAVIGLWSLAMVFAIAGIWLLVLNDLRRDEVFTPHALMGPGYATVGALILLRRKHLIGTLFLAFGLFTSAFGTFMQACTWAEITGEVLVGCVTRLGDVLWPTSYAFFGSLLLLFPTGRLPSKRWVPVAGIFTVSWALTIGIPVVGGQRLLEERLSIAIVVAVWSLALVALAPLFRIRRASPLERQQLRYLGYVVAICLVGIAIGIVFDLTGLDAALGFVNTIIFGGAAVGIPAAIGIAILRYRLYEIDVVINRTLVYGSLTAVLAAAYVGLVFAFQAVLSPVTEESDLAIAASTLAVAALFRPMSVRVQSFIDRRFYRRKFDVAQTLEEFSAHLKDEVDLSALSSRLTEVVGETMQPTHVSLWVRSEPSA